MSPAAQERQGPREKNNRLFLEAVLWIARTGSPWRDLPECFGRWNAVYRRFRRWAMAGFFERLHRVVAKADGSMVLLLDSTVVRAHQHAAGVRGGQACQALGRSRGGFSTKIHAAVSAEGHLMAMQLTGGQVSDYSEAENIMSQIRTPIHSVIADRGYDSDTLVLAIEARGAQAVIPPRRHRRVRRAWDSAAYRMRNAIERFFGRLKQFRRIATRFEKTSLSYFGMVMVAALVLESRLVCRA